MKIFKDAQILLLNTHPFHSAHLN